MPSLGIDRRVIGVPVGGPAERLADQADLTRLHVLAVDVPELVIVLAAQVVGDRVERDVRAVGGDRGVRRVAVRRRAVRGARHQRRRVRHRVADEDVAEVASAVVVVRAEVGSR